MADTICIEPDALVYGMMGGYGVYQKQSDYIHSEKMGVIRACANGYITPDTAASQILALQSAKPISPESGKKTAQMLSDGFRRINESLSQRHNRP